MKSKRFDFGGILQALRATDSRAVRKPDEHRALRTPHHPAYFARLPLRLLSLGWIWLSACAPQTGNNFPQVDCQLTSEFDQNQVLKTCRQFTYDAKYWDAGFNLISQSKVKMTVSGNSAATNREDELEVVVQYQFDPVDVPRIDKYNLNNDFKGRDWVTESREAALDNGLDTWITPFRENQFAFTQMAPYPSVNLPLGIDKQWTSNLLIYGGWGDWDNQQLLSNYLALDPEEVELPFETVTAWHVTSYVDTDFGRSTHDFWYHDDYGFVKMQYKNYQGQLLIFELMEIE